MDFPQTMRSTLARLDEIWNVDERERLSRVRTFFDAVVAHRKALFQDPSFDNFLRIVETKLLTMLQEPNLSHDAVYYLAELFDMHVGAYPTSPNCYGEYMLSRDKTTLHFLP
jgi:hypothetical protein